MTSSSQTSPSDNPCFATTHWTVVLSAGSNETPRSHAALESLCRTYWYPLYAYIRRRGYQVEDARDLTQQFFTRLLEHNFIARADQTKGRFRSFLLTGMEHFLANEWDKARAAKRGGANVIVPIQTDNAETRYGVEPIDDRTPAQVFEYNWALALLEHVMEQLETDYEERDQQEFYRALRSSLVTQPDAQYYADLSSKLEMSPGAVRVAVHRLRARFRELLRREISNTLDQAADVDAEMSHLFKVLARA